MDKEMLHGNKGGRKYCHAREGRGDKLSKRETGEKREQVQLTQKSKRKREEEQAERQKE